jgi:hypothetical protein
MPSRGENPQSTIRYRGWMSEPVPVTTVTNRFEAEDADADADAAHDVYL